MDKIKHIAVVPYNPEWPNMFEAETIKIKKVLGNNCVAIHHIGSTSVPGLSAKPKIDIIAVVGNLNFSDNILLGYLYRGGFNIPLRKTFTSRNVVPEVNLHIFEEGDDEVELNLLFRNYLRQNDSTARMYEALKYELIKNESSHQKNGPMYSGYTLGKYDFIQNILDKAGFRGTRFVICTHHKEWEVYHRIRKEQIFAPLNIIYDTNHPYLTSHRHYHFILYKGVNIVTVAHVEFFNNNESAIRSLATDTPYKQKGYGKMMIFLLEKWLRLQNKHVIKVHSNLNSENFYRKLGYHDMSFNDQSISKHIVDLGKILPK